MTWQLIQELAPQTWVVWLVGLFVAVGFYAFRRRNKSFFDDCAQIPFRNDDQDPTRHG